MSTLNTILTPEQRASIKERLDRLRADVRRADDHEDVAISMPLIGALRLANAIANLRGALETVEDERDALARVLNAVPTEIHNAAVRESGVELLDYTHAMEHGVHLEPDVPLPRRMPAPALIGAEG